MSDPMKLALKGKLILHPNSRKCLSIIKKTNKQSNKQKKKQGGLLKQSFIAEKLLWFQQNMVPDICPYTAQLTDTLIQRYINRNDEELEQIKIKHSIGKKRNRQHASREDAICHTKERESQDYETCGIEMPDILNSVQCTMLRKWNGDLRFLPNFKLKNYSKKYLIEESKKDCLKNKTENEIDMKDHDETNNVNCTGKSQANETKTELIHNNETCILSKKKEHIMHVE